MIRFEALQAQYGDCFLIRWSNDKLAVIDGGPSGVYPILKRRLAAIAQSNPLAIQLMMVSHIDDDHINGLLSLLQGMAELKDSGKPPIYAVQRFWFNSFEDIIGAKNSKSANDGLAALVSNVAELNNLASHMDDARAAAVLKSVPQGRQLRDLISLLKLTGNQPVKDLLVGSLTPVEVEGLKVSVVGPLSDQLEALREEWKKAPRANKAEFANYIDTSTANLSSVVCLVEFEGKRILLTGDARGDYILDGLRKYGHLNSVGKLDLDLLKLPHHGSDRDSAPDFFEALPAKNYVISANGKYDNPDKDTLKWLIEARGDAQYTIHLTNELPWMPAFFSGMVGGKNFKVNYRGTNDDDIIDIQL